MNAKWRRLFRIVIPALLVAVLAFAAGGVATLEYLGRPTTHTWTGKVYGPGRFVANSLSSGFENMIYNRGVWADLTWLGTPIAKYPTDLLVYQEMIYQLKPDLILDIGTFKGGSALYYATMFDLMGITSGRVISVDIALQPGRPQHPRITYLLGSSTSEPILKQIRQSIRSNDKVMVFLDSDYSCQHVLAELRAYGPMVTTGSYLVVEDSNVNGHPVYQSFGPGPMEAIQEFMKGNPGFQIDESRQKFVLTVAPDGFLRKL